MTYTGRTFNTVTLSSWSASGATWCFIRTPFHQLGSIPGTAVSKDTVWSPESKSQWVVWRSREPRQGKAPGSEASPALHTWCPNRAWAHLGVGTGWGAVSRERIFTTETKTVFHHPNADERPKGIISQSVAWEVNRGHKPERAPCTNKCNFCWLNQGVRPLDTERALDCARGTLVSMSFKFISQQQQKHLFFSIEHNKRQTHEKKFWLIFTYRLDLNKC